MGHPSVHWTSHGSLAHPQALSSDSRSLLIDDHDDAVLEVDVLNTP